MKLNNRKMNKINCSKIIKMYPKLKKINKCKMKLKKEIKFKMVIVYKIINNILNFLLMQKKIVLTKKSLILLLKTQSNKRKYK